VHEQGYTVRLDPDGEPHFENRHGVPVENVPRPPPSDRDALRHQHCHLQIDHNTGKHGAGDRMNLNLAVDALIASTAP
jgi:hypothetical protein